MNDNQRVDGQRSGTAARGDASRDLQRDAEPGVSHEPVDDTTRPTEFGGRKGPEPTRYGDWEKNGRCIDF